MFRAIVDPEYDTIITVFHLFCLGLSIPTGMVWCLLLAFYAAIIAHIQVNELIRRSGIFFESL